MKDVKHAMSGLLRAAEQIGAANFARGVYRVKRRRGKVVEGYSLTEAHRMVLKAIEDLGKGKISPEQAKAVLLHPEVFRERFKEG